jgi:hypothetical protein
MSSTSFECEDFSLEIGDENKKRWFLYGTKAPEMKSAEANEDFTVIERPLGSEEFKLKKENPVKNRWFIDANWEESSKNTFKETAYQGENLSLLVLVSGIFLLLVILVATGVL